MENSERDLEREIESDVDKMDDNEDDDLDDEDEDESPCGNVDRRLQKASLTESYSEILNSPTGSDVLDGKGSPIKIPQRRPTTLSTAGEWKEEIRFCFEMNINFDYFFSFIISTWFG